MRIAMGLEKRGLLRIRGWAKWSGSSGEEPRSVSWGNEVI